MPWIEDMFHTEKPIIGLLYLGALPGDPLFSKMIILWKT